MKTSGSPLPSGASVSISRSLQVLAALAVLLIVGGTTHRLLATRALIIGDTAQELSRLDMVFAEQTGRAIECIAVIMAVYLTLSLVTSALMGWYNRRAAIRER